VFKLLLMLETVVMINLSLRVSFCTKRFVVSFLHFHYWTQL